MTSLWLALAVVATTQLAFVHKLKQPTPRHRSHDNEVTQAINLALQRHKFACNSHVVQVCQCRPRGREGAVQVVVVHESVENNNVDMKG